MGQPELLRKLREDIGGISCIGGGSLNEREFWRAPQFAPGIARGIVAELTGNASSEFLLELFQMHPEPFIFWCDRSPRLNAVAISQRGVKLSRFKFITSDKDLGPALRIAFEGGKFYPFIVAPSYTSDVKTLQRYHLLAQKSKSTLFLLAPKKLSSAWPISLQLEINFSNDGFAIIKHRQKHGIGK